MRSVRRRAAVAPALLLLLTPLLPRPPLLAAPPTKSRPEAEQGGPCPRRSRGGGSSRPQTGQRSGSSPSPPRWRGRPACTPVSRAGRALGWRLCRVAPLCRRRPALPCAFRGARGRHLRRRHRSRRPPGPGEADVGDPGGRPAAPKTLVRVHANVQVVPPQHARATHDVVAAAGATQPPRLSTRADDHRAAFGGDGGACRADVLGAGGAARGQHAHARGGAGGALLDGCDDPCSTTI